MNAPSFFVKRVRILRYVFGPTKYFVVFFKLYCVKVSLKFLRKQHGLMSEGVMSLSKH